jgi:hypothetical protein
MFFECWELRSSGLLDSKRLKFLTDVSGKPIGPIFKDQESQKELPLLAAQYPEERSSRLLRGGSLKSNIPCIF